MDWDKVTQDLSRPLDRANVDKRQGGGGKELSYIEGWWAIAEANRIFGHGGWSRETTELKLVTEKPAGYFAKVRVRVGDIVRDGCGWGSDVRGDHEKALKEAETDATKRALMTFGWQFGLALYDKTQANVTDGNGTDQPDMGSIKGDGASRHASNPLFGHLQDEMKTKDNLDDLNLWWVESGPAVKRMNSEHQKLMFVEMMKHGFDIAPSKLDLRQFLVSHKTDMKALEDRSKNKWEEVGDFYEQAQKAFEVAHQ